MAATKTARFASYKGRTYRLEFIGATKFGRRAKLAFMDGSKEFWVDASQVSECSTPRESGRAMRTCPHCGGNEANQVECGHCA